MSSNLVHAYVCFLQVKHNSIKKTPDYWKIESIYRIAEYLKNSENEEPFTRLNKLPLLLEEINKTLQKDFKLKIEKDIDEKTKTYYYRVK
ncbi:MAG: hypothetical protein IPP61_01355 [Cytophagaceae bacterium]|nr:hypothetical protein [Cytophagaceae bacterium]MBL0323825.1 hypothetical protein [Cytophagaceae bacterium]